MSTFDRPGGKVSSTLLERRLDYARVRVDEQGLWIDDALKLARADIASVRLALHDRTTVRMLNRDGRGVSCAFTSNDDVSELLAALGRVPERTMTEVALVPSVLRAGFRSLPWWKAVTVVGFGTAAWLMALPALLGRTHSFFRRGFPDLPLELAIIPTVAAFAAAWVLLPRLRRARASGSSLAGVLREKEMLRPPRR